MVKMKSRKKKSTLDTILAVAKPAKVTLQLNRRGMRYCAVVTLDVRNAFNSTGCRSIAETLQRLRVSLYLYKILGDYFQK